MDADAKSSCLNVGAYPCDLSTTSQFGSVQCAGDFKDQQPIRLGETMGPRDNAVDDHKSDSTLLSNDSEFGILSYSLKSVPVGDFSKPEMMYSEGAHAIESAAQEAVLLEQVCVCVCVCVSFFKIMTSNWCKLSAFSFAIFRKLPHKKSYMIKGQSLF